MQPGDLVTAADAPEGCPSWVGEIVDECLECARDTCVRVARLGGETPNRVFNGQHVGVAWIRPLTDAEAVAVAEMLVGTPWKDDRRTTHDEEMIGGCVYFRRPRADVRSVLARVSEEGGRVRPWCWASNNAWGCADDMGRIEGAVTDIEAGRGRASRALIAYTIRGQP